jgi:UDP-N-acetylmuramate dehydrogenase
MSDFIPSAMKAVLRGKLLSRESLAHYTSWRTGGHAECLYIPADLDDLAFFLKTLPSDLPLTWLGLGSNTLVRDGGLDGVVLITQGALTKLEMQKPLEFRAEAGVASAQLARFSARAGAKGLEFLAGIPGTIGGALAMNAGCFGGETWRHITKVETMNRRGEIRERTPADFEIAYRHVTGPIDEWFIAGHFTLSAGNKDLSLKEIRTLLARRNQTQPTGTANCGSVFRNPPGDHAAKLIESCGLKGKSLGGACVSEKHANFIINSAAATAADIEKLIMDVGNIVHDQTGIRLIPEVRIMGKD